MPVISLTGVGRRYGSHDQAVERATGGWAGLGHFFTTISAAGVTAVLAVAAAALLAGGFATIRRLAV